MERKARFNRDERASIAHALMHLEHNGIAGDQTGTDDWYCGNYEHFVKRHRKAIALLQSLLAPVSKKEEHEPLGKCQPGLHSVSATATGKETSEDGMKPAEGGRRTRIRKIRPDRKKRHYPSRMEGKYDGIGYPPNGGNVEESMARAKVQWQDQSDGEN